MAAARQADPGGGRAAAVQAVGDALAGRRFAIEGLHAARSSGRLSGREAGLAMEIALGTLRHLITIEHILQRVARYDPQRTLTPVRAALTTGAYQIIWMDRVPTFAAVDQAVALASAARGRRAAGMVNAVLRRLGRAIATPRLPWKRGDDALVRVSWDAGCQFNQSVLPDPQTAGEPAHVAAAAGETTSRLEALVERLGAERAEAAAWAAQALPVTVVQRNPLRATPEAFEQALASATGGAAEFAAGAAFLPAATPIADLDAFRGGLMYVQDQTARAAARAVNAQPGETVLDLCAAPGGKTIAIGLALHDRGRIVACDVAEQRLRQVDANATRLGLACVRTRLVAAGRATLQDEGLTVDAALVDVPCSNTGVIARRPEARLGLTENKLKSLVALQQRLLTQAAACVRPAGRLVYSTCSIEPAENEALVTAWLNDNPGWQLVEQSLALPAWGPRLADWRDGGYFARLVRQAQ